MWDLTATRRAPLLRGTAKALCGFLMRPNTRSIAVVGNGPLKPEQRAEIQGFDKVVRFNALNNRCGTSLGPCRRPADSVAATLAALAVAWGTFSRP